MTLKQIEQIDHHGLRNFSDQIRCVRHMAFVDGLCYITIDLAKSDLAVPIAPDHLIIQVPRCSYLPAYFADISDHFEKCIVLRKSGPDCEKPMVFFCPKDETEVPWHFPIGMQTHECPPMGCF